MKYMNITSPDINNGLGCRVTLWVSGCMHKCPGCHNPETHDYAAGKKWDEDAEKELFEKLSKPYIKGLTLSGGDPLYQTEDTLNILKELLHKIKKEMPEKDIWLYTGFTYEQLNKSQREVLEYVDTLVDGPFILEQRDVTLPFRGSTNQRILNMKDLRS